jgi:hypothetical protein
LKKEARFDPDVLDLVENVERTDLPMSGRILDL